MVAAWKRGDIDAGYVWGPFSHTMEGDGGKQILATEQLQKNGYYVWNDYVVRKEFADKYPEIVVKFLQTFQQTVDMYNKDKEGDGQAGRSTLEPERGQCATRWPACTSAAKGTAVEQLLGEGGSIVPAMMDTARFLVELGDLKQSEVPPSFKPFINLTYMERAVR